MPLLSFIGALLFVGTMLYAHIIGAQNIDQLVEHLVDHFWLTQVWLGGLLVCAVVFRLAWNALYPTDRKR